MVAVRCENHGQQVQVYLAGSDLPAGLIELHGRVWWWTCGLGWHANEPTFEAAYDALLADPAFGVNIHA